MNPVRSIFVYGTLMPDQHNAYLWRRKAVATPAILTDFRLVSWHQRFPYAIPAKGEQTKGYLLTSNDMRSFNSMLNTLDRLEGYPHHYGRKLVEIQNGDEIVVAWVYTPLDPETYENDSPVADNDWASFVSHQTV